ncbi:hypothetical protein EB796_012521 [Bugula neritina]|uniref:Uncharacterized protein n=1 Tax=Bugula neritina TaxID=10212 RepID=A0A7J7JTF7_BUGNE|nr:hypothetical protein EB796_012521 [Bugula neritina]
MLDFLSSERSVKTAYMANVLVNGRAASPLASSSSSSYGLADLKLPEPKDPHPQEWRLPHEHKMEKREVYYSWQNDVQSQILNIEAKLNESLQRFPPNYLQMASDKLQ